MRLAEGVSFFLSVFQKWLITLRVCFHSFLRAGSELLYFYSKRRFPGIDLTCWTQLFRVACRILKLLLKLPYSCNPFHVNLNKQVLRLERDDVIIISPFAVIVTFASSGATLFCFCGESSTTVPTGFNVDLNVFRLKALLKMSDH